MLEEKLRELGLSEKEVAVYTAVVDAGKASPARVAKSTGIKRPTVYVVGADLIQKGLLEADNTGPTTYYFPASTQTFKRKIEREKYALSSKEKLFEQIAQEIEQMPRSKTYVVPKIQFIEHEENVLDFLHKQADTWNKSLQIGDQTWWGFQDDDLVSREPYRRWIKWIWARTPESVSVKFLSNNSASEKQMQKEQVPRRFIKFWDGTKNFTATQWVVGNYSVLVQTQQKPHYLVQMHDPVYTANMREFFKNVWQII